MEKRTDVQPKLQLPESQQMAPINVSTMGGNAGGSSFGSGLRDYVSMPLGGGTLAPAKVGKGYGVRWNKTFNEGGKVSSASKRADGIAKRGKTKGRMR